MEAWDQGADLFLENLSESLKQANAITAPFLPPEWQELPGFILFLSLVFLVSLLFWKHAFKLDDTKAALLASCTISTVHGIVCATIGYRELTRWTSLQVDDINTPHQITLTQFSLAYMVADFSIYLMPWEPTNMLFVVHHIISAYFLVGVLHTGRGAISGILMFFMGEVTSPLLNAFTFAKELRKVSTIASKLFIFLSPLFTIGYILVRTVIAPPLVLWFCYSWWFRSSLIPGVWRWPMGGVVFIGIIASQAWTVMLIKGYKAQQAKKQKMKEM
jgi:hypothetical protein